MNDDGYYDGWTDHILTVTPNLGGYPDMKISGRDRNNIKEYLYDTLSYILCDKTIDESTFYL